MGSVVNSPEQPSPKILQRQTRWLLQVTSVWEALAQGVTSLAGCTCASSTEIVPFSNGAPTANDAEISIESMRLLSVADTSEKKAAFFVFEGEANG